MTRAEIEALTERIVLATMDRDQIEDRAAFDAAHPEAAEGRRWIAERYRELGWTEYYPESEIRAKVEWIAGVLIETFGVEDHAGSPSVPSPNPPMPPGPAPGP
jgi:hypothetical protein